VIVTVPARLVGRWSGTGSSLFGNSPRQGLYKWTELKIVQYDENELSLRMDEAVICMRRIGGVPARDKGRRAALIDRAGFRPRFLGL
jgi:hypothetical protein